MANKNFDSKCWIRLQNQTSTGQYHLFVSTPMGMFLDSVEITEPEARKLANMFGIEIAKSSVYGGGFGNNRRKP